MDQSKYRGTKSPRGKRFAGHQLHTLHATGMNWPAPTFHGTVSLLARSRPLQLRPFLRRARSLGRRLARRTAGREEVPARTDSDRGRLSSSLDGESHRCTFLARTRHAQSARLSRRTWRSETRRLFALS